jgi:catechol 2,3-dioxygenase-like lactoylglutathione lyase family enzyme
MNLNQVTVPSLDVEKATEFYKLLGLKLIVDALTRYVSFECPDGDSTFSIHKVDELPKGNGVSIYL